MDSGLEERKLPLNPPITNVIDLPQRRSRRSGCAFQPDARSLFMSRVLFSTIRVVKGLAGTGGDLRSNRVHGEDVGTIRADQGLPLRPSFAINFSDAMM